MPTKKMLIDATHPEETRVVTLSNKRLEDFDVEVASKKQLKGNIYLAKVTRVEPSLQAAFIDYGGNRHGFLAFNEIHPDYYQIPVADREALAAEYESESSTDDDSAPGDDETGSEADQDGDENGDDSGGNATVETIGGDDTDELKPKRQNPIHRRYRIQEVIKRRQILLIQVVKEERGNKGAALTTYMSLAGRYCVLMPNSPRGGGVSRKITNVADRKRLKGIVADLNVPKGTAVIVRTAGSQHNKTEIKRDYEYLMRLWSTVRELTLESTAPNLIHEEGSLIKRAIRDLYSRDVEEIIVDGDEGYRTAKDFMKLLIPSHAKRIKRHKDKGSSLFAENQVESQLSAMHSPVVQLKSGGYIVINSTEALVAIDVNSGRATKERNIEETALKTNLEASDEVARQLRLRDLAGLIVIDYIDMEVRRNQGQVERRLKDAMKNDRARVQLGRISPFGLLELSRQRLRPSLFETSFEPCPYCDGTGAQRSIESAALHLLRAIEEEGMKRRASEVVVHVPTSVALYILNQKRTTISDMEKQYEFTIALASDDSLIPPDHRIERVGTLIDNVGADAGTEKSETVSQPESGEDGAKRRRPRRRRRRGKSSRDAAVSQNNANGETVDAQAGTATDQAGTATDQAGTAPQTTDGPPQTDADQSADGAQQADAPAPVEGETTETTGDDDSRPKRRRRGRRGGRRRKNAAKTTDQTASPNDDETPQTSPDATPETATDSPKDAAQDITTDDKGASKPDVPEAETSVTLSEEEPKKKPRRRATKTKTKAKTKTKTAPKTRAKRAPKKASDRDAGGDAKSKSDAESKPDSSSSPEPVASVTATKEPVSASSAKPETTPETATNPQPAAPQRKGWWKQLTS